VFMGSIAGYSSARVYKLFGGKEWKKNTLLTATLYPGLIGVVFVCINMFVAYEGLCMF
jgi:transmembrane 9 superfamily protein 2/4